MIKAIIFDFFDVIREDGLNYWLKKHGNARTGKFAEASLLLDRGEITIDDFYQRLADAAGQPVETVRHEMNDDMVLLDGMEDLLRDLQGKIKLALLSNSDSAYLRNELAKYDLEKYFDLIVISSEVGMAKPEPEIFAYILEKLQLDPAEVLFIDDNPKNIEGGQQAGIAGIVFTDAQSLRNQLKKFIDL